MSWDPQIASVTGAGFNAAIYAADTGAPYTTDSLQMKPEEVKKACTAVKQGAAGCCKAEIAGKKFMILRNDEDMCYFKQKGEGGGCFGKTNGLIVAATYAEGQQAGQLNDVVGKVVSHLKSSGY